MIKKELPMNSQTNETREIGKYHIDVKCSVISAVIATVAFFIGIIVANAAPETVGMTDVVGPTVFILILALWIQSTVCAHIFTKRKSGISSAKMREQLYSQRENSKKSAEKLRRRLSFIRACTYTYTVLLTTMALTASLVCGVIYSESGIGIILLLLPPWAVLYAVLRHIPERNKRPVPDTANGYLARDEYKRLYASAERARDVIGVEGEVHLYVTSDCTASVVRVTKRDIIINVGAILASSITEAGMYAIFLHEFSHMEKENDRHNSIIKYNTYLQSRSISQSEHLITDGFFHFLDTVFTFNCFLYEYASSIIAEERADRAMLEHADNTHAAAALLTLHHYDMFEWEIGSYDSESIHSPEELEGNVVRRRLEEFNARLRLRRDVWNELTETEILARTASHPTIKMRRAALGVTDYSPVSESSAEYVEECERLVDFVDRLIYKDRQDSYTEERKVHYLRYLEKIEKWEADGRPITATGYSEIIFAHLTIGRCTEALALCDRVIELLPETAASYAIYMKGVGALHRLDESGIALIYRAIELSMNYFDEGMQTIGSYCCIAGKEDELEKYRERAEEMEEEYINKHSKINSLSPSDDLVTEPLEGDMREKLAEYIAQVGAGVVSHAYIVRKVITDDFFTSAVIVERDEGASLEDYGEAMSKIYEYLDKTTTWQFSLFSTDDVPMAYVHMIDDSLLWEA